LKPIDRAELVPPDTNINIGLLNAISALPLGLNLKTRASEICLPVDIVAGSKNDHQPGKSRAGTYAATVLRDENLNGKMELI